MIKGVFIDKIPVARIAKSCFCHRNTVYYRIEKIIEAIAEVYFEQFGA